VSDINDTLRADGPDAVRARHDGAKTFKPPIFVASEKDVGALQGWGLSCWQMSTYVQEFSGEDVIVLINRDERESGRAVATSLHGVASRIRVLADWNGPAGWTADKLLAAVERLPDLKLRFQLVAFNDVKIGAERRYRVKGLLPRNGIAVIYGPRKCGKSFWTFDLTTHVALGWDYRGRRVQQGSVVYLALEGQAGFLDRIQAFRQHHPDIRGNVPFHYLPTTIDLVREHKQLIADIRMQHTMPAVVVIDTLNRSLRGRESSDEDMTAYINAAAAVEQAFGCLVVIIHHCGVDGSRPRGHTALGGAADVQIAVWRDAAKNVIAEVEFMKDGPEGAIIVSRLEVVEVGVDDDGDAISSCVIVATEAQPQPKGAPKGSRKPRLPGAAQTALRALREAVDEVGTIPPASNKIPANVCAVTIDQWRTYAYKMGISTGEKRAKEKALERASARLLDDHAIAIWGDFVWPASKQDEGEKRT
jgi:hypothetical protein